MSDLITIGFNDLTLFLKIHYWVMKQTDKPGTSYLMSDDYSRVLNEHGIVHIPGKISATDYLGDFGSFMVTPEILGFIMLQIKHD